MSNPNAKLDPDKAKFIRTNYGKLSARDLADRYGVQVQAIYAVIRGHTWQEVEK